MTLRSSGYVQIHYFLMSTMLEALSHGRCILHLSGPISQQLIAAHGSQLKSLPHLDANTGAILFRIFIEIAQNVLRHSAVKFPGEELISCGKIAVMESHDAFYIITENPASDSTSRHIQTKIDQLNQLPKEALRQAAREQLKKPAVSKTAGAGIGLIEIARRTTSPLLCKVVTLPNGETILCITATLHKSKS